MSTEVANYQPGQLDQTPSSNGVDPTGGRLVAWAASLVAAKQIANALCGTTFAPAHFRGKPDDGAAAIMYGDEIGFSPTQALRSIYVISGTPSLYARQMVAIVLHHGHEVWTEEKSDAKVTVSGRRRGSSHVHTETWTTARARQAGYLNNKKYASDPQAMLYARAAADICRQVAPDALAGLAFTVEELEFDDQPTTTTRRGAEPKTTAKRAAPRQQPEPEFDTPQTDGGGGSQEETSVAEGAAGSIPAGNTPPSSEPIDPQRINKAQLAKLAILLGEAGMPDRPSRLEYVSEVLGRAVESSTTLSKAEGSRVIEVLVAAAEGPFVGEPPPEEGR